MAHLAELSSLDATALADLVRSRSVSPLELVEATIARIEQINPSLKAIVTPMSRSSCRRATRTPGACRQASTQDRGSPGH